MLGDSTVGKTSISNRFLGMEFEDTNLMTLGNVKMETKMKMNDGKEMKIIINDTAGQERFHSIATGTVKIAHGIVLTFDVTNPTSFNNITNWLSEIKELKDKIPIVLFGNKCDKPEEERKVNSEDAKKLADANGLKYFETSAKTNTNIEEGFKVLLNEAYLKSTGPIGVELNAKGRKNDRFDACRFLFFCCLSLLPFAEELAVGFHQLANE